MKRLFQYALVCAFAFMMVLPLSLNAKPVEIDPALQDRYYALLGELRCLVCQNQSLSDSDAGLAQDLRKEVVKLLEQGASDDEILDFMHARYGDFVLYRPQIKPKTYVLWFGPFILLGGTVIVLLIMLRRRKPAEINKSFSEEEQARLNRLLDEDKDSKDKNV